MREKSEALRLADLLEMGSLWPDREAAARELRRLSVVETQRDALLEALKEMVAATDSDEWNPVSTWRARAAIKMVEEGK